MMRILVFIILGACFAVFCYAHGIGALNRARKKGLFPKEDKATLFDVRRLIQKGEKEKAVAVYTQIFKVGRAEAKRAVEELEKSLGKNKLESE